MKFSVCIDAVYEKKDFIQAMEEVHSLGYDRIEFWSWWDKDLKAIKQTADALGLEITAFCTEFISLTDKSRRADYLVGLQKAILLAEKLKCRRIITQVGDDTGEERAVQQKSIVTGLKLAAKMLEGKDITLLVEPLNNKIDHKNYYLTSSAEAFEIVDQVGSDQVKVLFDIYHQQITEGDLLRTIRKHISQIGHFHAAGNPGRHELSLSEINYEVLFAGIQTLPYEGCVGLEYFPIHVPRQGLREIKNQF